MLRISSPSWQQRYLFAVVSVAIAVVLKLLLLLVIQEESPFLLYFVAITLSSWYGGWGPGLLATALAALSTTYFFLTPSYSFSIASFGKTVRLGIFLLEGLSIGWLSAALKTAKQQAENNAASLRQSEESFRLLVEGVKDYAIFALDSNGYITSWNSGAERIKGYQPREILGQHISRLYSLADVEQHQPQRELQIAAETGRFETEGWRRRKDGSHFWANVSITTLRDEVGNQRGFVQVTRDITERRQMEIALRQSEQQFRATFNQAAVGIAHVGLDGKWLLVNQQLCDLVGYTKTELLERTFQAITHPEDLEIDLAYVRQMLADQRQTYSMEKRYIRQDGSLIWINLTVSLVRDCSGEPQYFISAIADISDRKQAEIALHRSHERLAALHAIDRAILAAQSAAELAQAALLRMRQLVPCQQACVVLFDFTQATAQLLAVSINGDGNITEGTTIPITDLIPTEVERQPVATRYTEDIASLQHRPPLLERRLAAGMHSLITAPLIADTELIGELDLFATQPAAFSQEDRDIASEVADQLAIAIQQTQLRQQLQRNATELEQRVADRTTALQAANTELEAFTYSVSHDLRAPLRAMQGFAQALLEDYADQLDLLGQDYAHRIVAAAQRMDTLINELLKYSRLSRAEFRLQPVSLAEVVSRAITELDSEIQQQQAQITVAQPLPEVVAHFPTLVQILINLLANAIKFVDSGSRPQISLWAELRSENGEEWVRLWVADNGIGIAPEHQQRIFHVFERLHGIETYPGTGIGLAVVRKGIERLGGRVGVESQVTQGSRFWLELPKNDE